MTPKDLDRDYGRLSRFLKGLSHRRQFLQALEASLLLAAGFLLTLLGSPLALRLEELLPYFPFAYHLTALSFLMALLLFGAWRVACRPPLERLARGLEEQFPHLKDNLTNSLLLFEQIRKDPPGSRLSTALLAAQLKKTAGEVCSIRPRQVIDLKKTLRHLKLLGPLALALAGNLAFDPHFMNRSLALVFHPFSVLPEKKISLVVEPRGAVVLRGSPVTIRAHVTGNGKDEPILLLWPEGREARRLAMKAGGDGRFSRRLDAVRFSFRYQVSAGGGASPVYELRAVDPPEIAGMKLTLIAPDYTGLAPEVRDHGQIEALKGTIVKLEARATKEVAEGKIVLDQGNQLLLQVRKDLLTGSLLVLAPGAYFLRVKDLLGFENPNPVHYPVRLIPDKFPEGEILSPAQDLEVSAGDTVPIRYMARDDFGVTAVRLNIEVRGKERQINLKANHRGRALGPETFSFDLSGLALTGGDRVTYRLEVLDNDTVSGPKSGYSRTFSLSIRDESTQAAREGEEAQQVAEALLDLLADHLEGAKDRDSLARGMDELLKKLDRSLERRGERMDRFDLEGLRRNLSSLRERIPREPEERVTQEMERLSLLAEDLSQRARMNEVEALAREMRNRQRRLMDSLEELKGPFGSEKLEELLKELGKLQDLLHSIMQSLGQMASRLPDEFVNHPELSGLPFQDLFRDLEELRQRLQAGDRAGALEAAQRLLQALSEMMAALGRAGRQAGLSASDRMSGEMSRQTGELGRILAEQKEILGQTEQVDRTRQKRDEEAGLKRRLARTEIRELLERLARTLPPEQENSLPELQKLLPEGKGVDLLQDLERELAPSSAGGELLKKLREAAEKLSAGEPLTAEEKGMFPGLSSRQRSLQGRTAEILDRLEKLAQIFPGLDAEILTDLREAAGAMGEAAGKLKGEDAPGAIPPEQEAIRRLSRSQQAMNQMSQQAAMRLQASRWGYPLAYDPRPGWYYGWGPMPTLPQPELNRPREKGFTGIDREEFDPPSKDAYQVPKDFREKVLEAMKEQPPSSYKREVERYFRGLSE